MIVEYTAEIKERLKRALPNLPPAIFDNPLIKKIDLEGLEWLEKRSRNDADMRGEE